MTDEDRALEAQTGEAHVDGWPLNSMLPPALPAPFDYCYEWDGPYGTRKFSPAQHNGMRPTRSVALYTADQMRAAVAAERERCLRIVRTYEVSVGNSAAGEIACEMTMDNLRQIAAKIREAPG